MRTLFVKDIRGEFQLRIDDDDAITFGPAVPFPARNVERIMGRAPGQVYALRVYAKDKRLRAVFTGVYEIREDSIRVDRLVGDPIDDIPMPREDDTEPVSVGGFIRRGGLGSIPTRPEGGEL